MSPLQRSVCTTAEMEQRVVQKVGMAYGVPIALVVSATVTLFRAQPDVRFVAFCLWLGTIATAAVIRILLVRSMRRDLDELRQRARSR